MFVAMPDPDQPEDIYYMIDPEIYEEEGSQTGEEGCLSVPGLVGTVERPERIRIRAKDLNGDMQDYEFTDFGARVMCRKSNILGLNTSGSSEPPPIIRIMPKAMTAMPTSTRM